MNKTIGFAAVLVIVWLSGSLLIAGRGLLVPLIMAIFIWHLLNTTHLAIRKLPWLGERLPVVFSRLFALMVVLLLVKVVVDIITNNVNEVILAAPRYQDNLRQIVAKTQDFLHIDAMARFNGMMQNISVQRILINIYGVFTSLTGSAVLIVLYVVFLFVEQHFFTQKLDSLFPQSKHRQLVSNILEHIVRDTQTYLGLKTAMSLLTALSSFLVMKWVGLDFAEFWALLIFFLNYIPNIGSIIATIFPAVLALIQFEHWLPFILITTGLSTIQFIVGNLIEPRFLGQSLNLSPLVILISLGFWGSIWGILGMFLSVPITVMMMIVFAHFENTRSIAVLLSQDGHIKDAYAKIG